MDDDSKISTAVMVDDTHTLTNDSMDDPKKSVTDAVEDTSTSTNDSMTDSRKSASNTTDDAQSSIQAIIDNARPKTTKRYAVSRSRGKRKGESLYTARLREARKAKGLGRPSDDSETEEELESGAVVLHHLFYRKVLLLPNGSVVKVGKRICLGEAEALKVAFYAGIPAPCAYEARITSDGTSYIRMDHIKGQSLDKVWPDMSTPEKKDIARQLREIIEKMRSVVPPPNFVGACDGTEIRDTRDHFTHHAPPCRDEKGFNEYLLSALYPHTPSVVREAFSRRLRTNHRIVLTHGDLAPRNIIVQDGKIQALVDWEESGWYPEYWEFIKFFHRNLDRDYMKYIEDIFPEIYYDEYVDYTSIYRWQHP